MNKKCCILNGLSDFVHDFLGHQHIFDAQKGYLFWLGTDCHLVWWRKQFGRILNKFWCDVFDEQLKWIISVWPAHATHLIHLRLHRKYILGRIGFKLFLTVDKVVVIPQIGHFYGRALLASTKWSVNMKRHYFVMKGVELEKTNWHSGQSFRSTSTWATLRSFHDATWKSFLITHTSTWSATARTASSSMASSSARAPPPSSYLKCQQWPLSIDFCPFHSSNQWVVIDVILLRL